MLNKNEIKADNNEMAILLAASKVFMEKGFDGTRMQEIADKAGINKSLLHYYYRTKEKLFYSVFSNVFKDMMHGLLSIFEQDNNIFESIRLFFRKHQSVLLENKNLPVFMLNEIHRDPQLIINLMDKDRLTNVREKFFKKITLEQQKGNIRDDVEPFDLFINILSLSIFPFAARPLITGMFSIEDEEFREMINKRKENLAEFVINSIKIK